MRKAAPQFAWSFASGIALAAILVFVVAGIVLATDEAIGRIVRSLAYGAATVGIVHDTLWALAATVAALAAFGFGAPLFAYLYRSRQQDEAQARVAYLEEHEPMTGLLARPRFIEAMNRTVAEHAADGRGLAMLVIDLDGLKEINDACGHDVGDEVIIRVARALRDAAGPGALVARLGGDEFAVARPNLATPAEAASLAATLLERIAAQHTIQGHAVAASARIGIAVAPADGDTVLRLMKAADLALDRARGAKPGTFIFFESTIENELQRRRELEQQIRDTLAADAFDLHYQPLFDTLQGGLVGFEALLRMPQGERGFISPAVFIPIAEEMGLITRIGDWVVRRACAVARDWPEHLSIAVNLSPAQFKEGGVHKTVQVALKETGLAPHRLQLEITEGLLLNDDAAIMLELQELKKLGVSIVMDDFGTGYSSLSYLWKFPFDKIKIDRSFMKAFEADDGNVSNILQAIMSLSRALRMRVTAEGVETEAQAQFLRNLGCDELQGYLLGRPMPLADVPATVLRDAQRRMGADLAAPEGQSIRLIAG